MTNFEAPEERNHFGTNICIQISDPCQVKPTIVYFHRRKLPIMRSRSWVALWSLLIAVGVHLQAGGQGSDEDSAQRVGKFRKHSQSNNDVYKTVTFASRHLFGVIL